MLELTSVEVLEPAKLAAFRDQMDSYFDAHEEYLVLYRKARTAGGEAVAHPEEGSHHPRRGTCQGDGPGGRPCL